MNLSTLALPADPAQTFFLRRVLNATTPAEETETDATTRCGTILEMFHGFGPVNALQAMIACHCISLEFVLNAAMRDACDLRLEPRLMLRARAGGNSLSRGLGQWMSKYDKLKARDEKRAAEAAESPEPVPEQPLPQQPVQTKPAPPKPAPRPIRVPPAALPMPENPPPFHVELTAPHVGRRALASSVSRIAMLAPMASISDLAHQAVRASLAP
jgi:hypothetical protein